MADAAAGARHSREDVLRAIHRADSTVTWPKGSVPSHVIAFLGAAIVDRAVLASELVALRRERVRGDADTTELHVQDESDQAPWRDEQAADPDPSDRPANAS
jgi:hypothetical protein